MARDNGKIDKAMELFKKDIDAGYSAKGEAYAALADLYRQKGDMDSYRETLEQGFAAFPENQQILVGLINYNLDTNGDSSKLFDLIHQAQANEPGNASLWYVEGDINKKLGNKEAALELFQKSYDIDNTYLFGIVNKGIIYYDEALEYQDKANAELDDAKYEALLGEVNNSLKKAIEPFEQSYELAKGDPELQVAIAEYLKNIYFRFRLESDEYMAAYEKYNAIYKQATE
jgi:tetratricopeptide (TPR) repeat protein